MEFVIGYLLICLIIAVAAMVDIMVPALPLLKAEKYQPVDIRIIKLMYLASFFLVSYIFAPIIFYVLVSDKRVREFIVAFNLAIAGEP